MLEGDGKITGAMFVVLSVDFCELTSMHYTIIESATGDELGTIETSADTAVEDLIEAGWLDGEADDYEADEDHHMASEGDIVILGPDFPELVLEPDGEYDENEDDEDDH